MKEPRVADFARKYLSIALLEQPNKVESENSTNSNISISMVSFMLRTATAESKLHTGGIYM